MVIDKEVSGNVGTLSREMILDEARRIVSGDRDDRYGVPEDNFGTIAELWSSYLSAAIGSPIGIVGSDVAAMMALLKIARIARGCSDADSWVDLAGYAACGGECAV